jgi:membrane protein implicated in regulation of membrane protease activity
VSLWIWAAVGFASVGLLSAALGIFIDRMNRRFALPRSYTKASMLLYLYAIEVQCVFAVEVSIVNTLRDQSRIPAQFSPDVAWWITVANVAYMLSGVLALAVAAVSNRNQRQQQARQRVAASDLADGDKTSQVSDRDSSRP